MSNPFYIKKPKGKRVPILVSVPHSGTEFPEDVKALIKPELVNAPDDTDWFIHDLYDFVTDLGITMIHAKYSRWVIDLNRDPEGKPLYNDGRIITNACTSTDFLGNKIYKSELEQVGENEKNRRKALYFDPYYKKVTELLTDLKQEFGEVIFFDAHSIRHFVPTIRKDIFPDMILGNNDETSSKPKVISKAIEKLREGKYQINHNNPFKGGFLTRTFGKPKNGIHALQLEMNKILYMDDKELIYHPKRAKEVQNVLKPMFEALIKEMA